MLSRLRGGAQDVGSTVARRIAKRLGTTATDRERIYQEVLATRREAPSGSGQRPNVDSSTLSQLGFFVEFRERPRMSSAREGAQTTALLARWLNSGLHYAMLSPHAAQPLTALATGETQAPAITKFFRQPSTIPLLLHT